MIEKKDLNSDYISRINRTFDYIEANREKPLTLEELATIANFSKFHFNRIFQSIVGETPFQFVLRVRLEKAATLILTNKSESITEIAYKCGFSDISIFSRNFKSYFQISATKYRVKKSNNSNLSQPDSNKNQIDENLSPYFCPVLKTIKWRTNMKLNKGVEVREPPKMTVAYIRNMGPWGGDKNEYEKLRNKLFSWAEARDLIFGKDFKYFILYHDDPNVAPGDKLRMSLCITVPPETKVNGEIGKMEIEAAKYAIARFELTDKDFQMAWEWLYRQWLPNSGYKLDDKPYFETYPEAPEREKFVVDFCIPVIAL